MPKVARTILFNDDTTPPYSSIRSLSTTGSSISNTPRAPWTPTTNPSAEPDRLATVTKELSCANRLVVFLMVVSVVLLVGLGIVIALFVITTRTGTSSTTSSLVTIGTTVGAGTTVAAGATVPTIATTLGTMVTTVTTSVTTSTATTSVTTTTITAGTTVCSTTVITTTVTSSPLPAQCSNATVITDGTRNAANAVYGSACDQSGLIPGAGGWFRFSGAAGTILASCPVAINRCSTQATGWYSGIHPASSGATTNGTVCYNWSSNTCNWSNSILVTNCNGFYVYWLTLPPVCSLRYCSI